MDSAMGVLLFLIQLESLANVAWQERHTYPTSLQEVALLRSLPARVLRQDWTAL